MSKDFFKYMAAQGLAISQRNFNLAFYGLILVVIICYLAFLDAVACLMLHPDWFG